MRYQLDFSRFFGFSQRQAPCMTNHLSRPQRSRPVPAGPRPSSRTYAVYVPYLARTALAIGVGCRSDHAGGTADQRAGGADAGDGAAAAARCGATSGRAHRAPQQTSVGVLAATSNRWTERWINGEQTIESCWAQGSVRRRQERDEASHEAEVSATGGNPAEAS